MEFKLHRSPEGKLKLYPNQTHTPKELLPETEDIEIPTDKTGLMDFINELLEKIPAEDSEYIDPIAIPEPGPVIYHPADITVEKVQDFIFDKASSAEVETLFTALGTRFHEMRKAHEQSKSP